MKRIKLFNLRFEQVFIRFYVMMAVVIGFGFLNQFTIAAVLGYIAAIGFILGVSFEMPATSAKSRREKEIVREFKHKTISKAA